MPAARNVFACLVHESPECVLDLVRNLRCLDPASEILLFNGGSDPALLDHGLGLERYDVHIHPRPQRLHWGRLHDFALESMRYALERWPFATLTIVDSDQLACRRGYSERIATFLRDHPRAGMLVNTPQVQVARTRVGPAAAALRERELWRPLLERFPDGGRKFVHWSFWPATTFTRDAAVALTQLTADQQLQEILARSKIWATEEVILPTLVALLGFDIVKSPCSYDFVQYRARFAPQQIDEALTRSDVYWLHPIARRYADPLRARLRTFWRGYGAAAAQKDPARPPPAPRRLLLSRPLLDRMKAIDGWLEEDEADLVITAAADALQRFSGAQSVVEVGSYCGRCTVLLGGVVQALSPDSRVYAIDTHDGVVGAVDRGLRTTPPTIDRFTANIAAAGLTSLVESVRKPSYQVGWAQAIALLVIDGLHDYVNVARDFRHFESFVKRGGIVLFHDYADYFPGVRGFVDELLDTGAYRKVACVRSLMVVEKVGDLPARPAAARPLVSCIMPTHNRRVFVPRAVAQFLTQDYAHRELIIVDDGTDIVADLIPPDPRIRYVRYERRLALGAKRNAACELARGELIAHWDDDDWMASWRIAYQVRAMREHPDADICGLARILFYDPNQHRAFEYAPEPTAPRWVAGGTMCYRRAWWEAHRFADIDRGEDTRFVRAVPQDRILPLPDQRFYVATMHAGSMTAKRIRPPRWQPREVDDVERLMANAAQRIAAAGAV
ncbi:MAG TPA: glycosyltransferase [Gemmatimonadales bacterium]|nr:glycosyltransferase [Gemmatimonadales bacterium]